ncbi:hypothetical protein HIM_02595 [Hirsutella minnesotensis 3608]|nr:hypothetical protein HIM_02595 [Hirsutella minnesotensis 3608]
MEAMDKVNGGKHDQQRRVSAVEQALLDEMNNEKKRYPGASDWARDEERLFEVMFLRQHLPLMPAHWNLDLSRVPLDYSLFDSSADHPPVIYAHSTKEFQGKFPVTAPR